jgi:Domain of unknown function (DUF4149)
MTTFSSVTNKPARWHNWVLLAAAFWLSGSLLVDFLVMPSLFISGMMNQETFSSAGYSLFWLFNRLELLCGAVILTGLLVLRYGRNSFGVLVSGSRSRWSLELGVLLMAIALLYTYVLTPTMGALGMPLDLLQPAAVPAAMDQMHGLYWALEMLKLLSCGLLLRLCYSDVQASLNKSF